MSKTGKRASALLCLVLLAAMPAWAAVDAQIDRGQAYLGDSLRLTFTATDGEDIDDADLNPIRRDFEILERSTSSNISIVNGKRSSTKEVRLELTPRRTGELRIPSLDIDGQRTRELRIMVSEAPTMDTGGQTVIFEAEVDRDSVYVQGQLILTLRLSQAINLDARSISELELDSAFVKTLEQSSFQRRIDGRPWLVHEVRYAIFPEQSGTLVIPAQTFTGRVREARRGLFDSGRGRLVRRQSDDITVEVIPRPADYPAGTWLPARRVDLIEEWSVPPEQLKVGESATRTVRLVGEGLQGAQLPPVRFTPMEGIKFYPDQPQISDREVTSGLQGVRTDSAAVVPTRKGTFEIPELRIPWWDTEREQLRYAVLPGRTLNVAPAPGGQAAASPGDATLVTSAGSETVTNPQNALVWQVIAGIAALGWLATLVALLRLKRSPRAEGTARTRADAGEREAFARLQAACKNNDAHGARAACIRWAAAQEEQPHITTLASVAAWFDQPRLTTELETLDAALYSTAASNWQGEGLSAAASAARDTQRSRRKAAPKALSLYPEPG